MSAPFSFRYQPVMGTELHVLVATSNESDAERAQGRVLAEVLRLQDLLSRHSALTPLSQWMRGRPDLTLPEEVISVLALAQSWYVASEGAFHPGLGLLRDRWRRAEQEGHPPEQTECERLAQLAVQLPFKVQKVGGRRHVDRTGDCTTLDLDALAKGWIVDRAAEAGMGPGIDWLLANAGGDLRVVGLGSVQVAIEDPASNLDNAAPLGVVRVGAAGLASSGSARRGFQVGHQWFGHVLNPRTGWPVQSVSGVTVVAPDAVTADALATVVSIDGLELPKVAALLAEAQAEAISVAARGEIDTSPKWSDYVISGFATG